PAFTARNSIASFKRTERCPPVLAPASAEALSSQPSAIHARPSWAANLSPWPGPPASPVLARWGGSPLDTQIVQRFLILGRECVVFDLPTEALQIADFQVAQLSQHGYVAANLGGIPYQCRHQQASLSIHLHHLTVVVGPV